METIGQLVGILGTLVNLVHSPDGEDITARSCSIVDAQDAHQLAADIDRQGDVVMLLGTDQRRLRQFVHRVACTHPSLIMVKSDAEDLDAFSGVPVAVAIVHDDVGWGQLHSIIDRVIVDGRVREQAGQDGTAVVGSHTDLFGLANTLAAMMGGLVSIDDPQTRALAFSPLDDSADDLRRRCIMGRAAPPEHVEELRKQGILSRLRQSTEAFVLPATATARPRLGVGLHDEVTGEFLGAIWVQQGAKPFKPHARQTLEAGGLVASRLIDGSRRIPSQESELLQQLVGLKVSTGQPVQLTGSLKLQSKSGWTIVGFSTPGDSNAQTGYREAFTGTALGSLSLRAVGLRSTARVTYGGSSLYAIIPDPPEAEAIQRWANQAVRMLAHHTHEPVRAAIGPQVASPADLPQTRAALDEILRTAHRKESQLVVSYDEYETNLTLSRVFDALRSQKLIGESRLTRLKALPHADGEALVSTLLAYFDTGGNVRDGAKLLHVHPNTMRQRLRRVEDATRLNLAEPEDRLLLELEARTYTAA